MFKEKDLIIIAEAGVNHDGCIKKAKKLIDIASTSKAKFIKFQTYKAENLVTKKARKAKYQIKNTKNKKETQYEMLKKLELSSKDYLILKRYCIKKKIKFLSTPFDSESFDLLKKIGLNIFKISSSDLNNLPFLEYISKKSNKSTKIILSTGMGNLKEIIIAIRSLTKFNIFKKNISILHCTSNYPASDGSLNLNVIKTLKQKLRLNIGYSDHSVGVVASLVAIGMGINLIEKHFTLNQFSKGPDHKASLNPKQFKEFTNNIFRAKKMLGSNLKKTQPEEIQVKKVARKSVVASKKIKKGEKFSYKNLLIKRPGTGLEPKKIYKLIGKISKKNFRKDQIITI